MIDCGSSPPNPGPREQDNRIREIHRRPSPSKGIMIALGKKSPLLIEPLTAQPEYIRVSASLAQWERLNFAARRMRAGETWTHDTGGDEMAIVVLGGRCSVESNHGRWEAVGRRSDVFHGMPFGMYFPRNTKFTLHAQSDDVDLACGWTPVSTDHPAALIHPENVGIEIRGGGNATRQINSILPPGFDCERLVVVEVYTPSGNWSSYPPHKHDEHRLAADGRLLEADLEEIYFYKFDRPEGYAIQRVYTRDRSLDDIVLARTDHLVLVPEGYHPVVSANGYTTYYLNFLAGSAQSLANSDDPDYAWIKESWGAPDPRLPIVELDMQAG